MTDRELLELIAAQVGKLTQDVGELKEGQKGITQRLTKVESMIENDVNTKLEALLDGYKQNAEKIEKIEGEVTKQEEFIMKRVK